MSVHVVPIDDLYEHNYTTPKCWCNPIINNSYDEEVVIHNSADGREKFESGERKVS